VKSRNPDESLFSGVSRDTVLLAFASFFADTATEMLYPVLPIFLTQVLLAPATVVGVVEGIADGTKNAIQGFSGWFSDRIGRRKNVALFGYGLAAVAKPFIGLSGNWPQVLAARFVDRFGTGVRSAPRDALVAGSVDEAHRGKAFGLEGIGDNSGAFVGPLVSALLVFAFHFDLRAIFFLAFVPGMLAFLIILLVRERPVAFVEKARPFLGLKQFPSAYWKYILVTALFGLGNFSSAFLILKTQAVGASTEITLLIYAGFNFTAAIVSFPAGSISDRVGRKPLLLTSFIVSALSYAGFAFAAGLSAISPLFLLYGVYTGVFRAIGRTFVTDFVPQAVRASAIGWYSTTVGLTGLVASVLAGQFWVIYGPQYTFIYGALFSFLGSMALLLGESRTSSTAKRP